MAESISYALLEIHRNDENQSNGSRRSEVLPKFISASKAPDIVPLATLAQLQPIEP